MSAVHVAREVRPNAARELSCRLPYHSALLAHPTCHPSYNRPTLKRLVPPSNTSDPAEGVREPSSAGVGSLSVREREVLALICSGLTNRRIADTLSISTTTAERHVHNILTKLCCANRAEAAAIATRLTQAPTNGHAPPANGNSALQSAMAQKRPVVRFLQAGDGAPLAWTSIGSGPPVVLVPNFPFCHVSLIDQLLPDWFESMSARATLTWYDSRGCGLSQRESADFGLERQVEDLHAVLASLPLTQPPVLCCLGNGSPVGIRYAALYPNALSHLVIIDGWATAADLRGMTSQRVADALSGVEWKTYTEVIAGLPRGTERATRLSDTRASFVSAFHPRATRRPNPPCPDTTSRRTYRMSVPPHSSCIRPLIVGARFQQANG